MNKDNSPQLQKLWAPGSLIVVLAIMIAVAHASQPLPTWLIWRYAGLWLLCALFSASCMSAGHLVVVRCLGKRLPLGQHLLFAFAAGLWIFATGISVAGLLGLFNAVLFCVWPIVLLAVGAPAFVAHLRPRWQRYVRLRGRLPPVPRPWQGLLWALGLVGFLLAYIPTLTPANLAYDSRWYHLGVAEHYVHAGGIQRFAEGWFHATLPQFASWLYTWALLMPRTSLFMRTELAAHLEVTIFIATLFGTGLLVRWLSGGRLRYGGGVAVFLFPGLFLYDSNLSGAADHILAFWAPVVALLLPYLWGTRARGAGVLLGLFIGAAVLTKYQAIYITAGAALWLTYDGWQRQRSEQSLRPWLTPLLKVLALAIVVATLGTATHWLRNWLWYGNPLYPMAQAIFGGHPWAEGTVVKFEDPGWTPSGNFPHRVLETVAALFTFSLHPHDWKKFHGMVPVFGALYPLLLLPALALKNMQRTWKLAAAASLGVLVWYATYHQDRYLQSLLPWLAAVVAVIIAKLWQTQSRAVQIALAGTLAFQFLWSADVPFLTTHAMAGKSPFEFSLSLASSTYRKAWSEQTDMHSSFQELQTILPATEQSVVLLHEEHVRFGVGRTLVTDGHGRQGAIRYHSLATPAAVHHKLTSLGVTHILWKPTPKGAMLMTDDLVFHQFVRHHTDLVGEKKFKLSKMRTEPPGPSAPGQVLFVTCESIDVVPWDDVDARWRTQFKKAACTQQLTAAGEVHSRLAAHADVRFALVDADVPGGSDWLPPGFEPMFDFKGAKAFSRSAP